MADKPILRASGVAVHSFMSNQQVALLVDISDERGETVAHVLGVLDVAATKKLITALQNALTELDVLPVWVRNIDGLA